MLITTMMVEVGGLSCDIVIQANPVVVVEVDGPSHFLRNLPREPLGTTVLKARLLAAQGVAFVRVPYFDWGKLNNEERQEYLQTLVDGAGKSAFARNKNFPHPQNGEMPATKPAVASELKTAAEAMTVVQLKAELKAAGLKVSGRKVELVGRLIDHQLIELKTALGA